MFIIVSIILLTMVYINECNRQAEEWRQQLIDASKTSHGFGVEGVDYFIAESEWVMGDG